MGNGIAKGLSVNAKTIILILLFVDIGFTIKMIKKYHAMKDAGYVREKTIEEQMEKRVMMAFGSAEAQKKIVADSTRQKEKAEKAAASLKEEDKKIRRISRELANAKARLLSENSRLQIDVKKLKEKLKVTEKESASLKRQISKLQPL